MNFKKNDTLVVKGFAIIFLLCYHCFGLESSFAGKEVIFSPLSKDVAMYIADSMNVCVGMFAILSVYGMTISLKLKSSSFELDPEKKVTFAVKRYLSLLSGFLIPFLVCQIVTFALMDDYFIKIYGTNLVQQICNVLLDLFGLSMFFGTPILVGTWWYVGLTVLFIAVLPIFIDLYKKYSLLIIPVWAFVILFSVTEVTNMNRWLLVIPIGIWLADKDCFYRLRQWKADKWYAVWGKRLAAILLFVLLAYIRKHPWGFQYMRLIVNCLTPVVMIYIIYEFLYKWKRVQSVFAFLGKHSGNIFYIHTFIRWIWFKDLTYSFRYAALIFLFLFGTSLLASMVIELFKKVTRYNKAVGWLLKKVEAK